MTFNILEKKKKTPTETQIGKDLNVEEFSLRNIND